MTVEMLIVDVLVGVVVLAAVVGMVVLIAAVLRVLQVQIYVSRGGIQMPTSDHPDEFEAPITREYANLSK
ncbi:MAG TPA: hypothetical protein VFW69_13910 [Mycobacterium sp.]|nr:hypothetical protein [Mycobacterium sp.]